MIQLLILLCVVTSSFTFAMDGTPPLGVMPMELSEEVAYNDFMKASFHNDLIALRRIFEEHAVMSGISHTPWGTNPLNWAAYHGNVPMAEFLLMKGFEVSLENDGSSAIHIAAYRNKSGVLKLLLTRPGSFIDTHLNDNELVEKHFKLLTKILNTPTSMQGVWLTPYQLVPGAEENTVCRAVLKPDGLRERLEPAIIAYVNQILINATLKRN